MMFPMRITSLSSTSGQSKIGVCMNIKPSMISDAALLKATGKSWAQWKKVLQIMKAKDLNHKDIAAKLSSEHDVPGWWAQGITVRFEQEIGRRKPGQRSSGEYNVSVSATFDGSMDELLAQWSKTLKGRKEFDGVSAVSPPVTTTSPKWRYWKVKLQDGTRVTVNISEKPGGKALLQVQHENLPDQEGIARWRAYWRNIIKTIEK
jgi:hypothetical protein